MSTMGDSASLLFPSLSAPPGASPMLSPTHVPFSAAAAPAVPLLGANAFVSPAAARTGDQARPMGSAAAPPLAAAKASDRHLPPLQSLFDVGGAPPGATRPVRAGEDGGAAAASAATARTPARGSLGGAPKADGLWVTAFGFNQSAQLVATVLDELRPSGGEVLQHRIGAGPWVHVQYVDWQQQQQALAKNGKVCLRLCSRPLGARAAAARDAARVRATCHAPSAVRRVYSQVVRGWMLGVIEGIHPPLDGVQPRPTEAYPTGGAGVPLRLQQRRPATGLGLRAPPIAVYDLGKGGWWRRLCELLFGW